MKSLEGIWFWISILLLLACTAQGKGASNSDLIAAAGKVDITPTRTAFLAGYGINRKASEANDPLMARCLVLESGGTRIAIVSCDLLGVPRMQSEKIRAMVKSVSPDHLIIGATHTHSGPDILGMWGPDIQTSGVDQEWMASYLRRVAQLIEDTAKQLKPAAVRFADTTEVPRISKNIRIPRVLDTELGVMQVVEREGGKPIATLVNYACHPEILNTRKITADFPHWLYGTVEGKGGGVCLYLNGAQGGMITADYDETTAPKGENWKAAETIGTLLGERVLQILEKAETVRDVPITHQRRIYTVPLENQRYKTMIALGVFPKGQLKNGNIETEVCRFTIGPAEFVTIPGEALPNIGFYLKRMLHGKPKFLFGLTGDFLGYILTPEDFGLDLYSYETYQSVGSQMEPLLVQNLRSMLPLERSSTSVTKP
jgi:hypothetical protein